MATINAVAHPNELTKDVKNDFYLTPQVTTSLTLRDIIERLRKREIVTRNVDGIAFVQTFLDECAASSAEGNNIVTSFLRSSIGIQGEGDRPSVENAIIYPNTPSKLQFTLPAEVGDGEWQVEVTTQATGSSTVLMLRNNQPWRDNHAPYHRRQVSGDFYSQKYYDSNNWHHE